MTDDQSGPPPLPPRPPRSLVVHWAVDSAVVLCAALVLALFFGVPVWAVAVAAGVAGVALAPVTRRAEARGLAARVDRNES